MSPEQCRGLVINAPEIFADPDFQDWLKNDDPKFTWYRSGPISEWSDVIVLVDPSLTGEGSDQMTMPEPIWNRIIQTCREHLGASLCATSPYVIRLTNLAA